MRKLMLFEVTKLRIWKQLTTSLRSALIRLSLFEVTKLRIWKQLTTKWNSFSTDRPVVWGHKVTNLKATHNQSAHSVKVFWLFEVTKLRIWKQLTTLVYPWYYVYSCLRSQSYEFESNSQQPRRWTRPCRSCLRSQSYEFESNSQPMSFSISWTLCCLRSQSYEFESNSQRPNGIIIG